MLFLGSSRKPGSWPITSDEGSVVMESNQSSNYVVSFCHVPDWENVVLWMSATQLTGGCLPPS